MEVEQQQLRNIAAGNDPLAPPFRSRAKKNDRNPIRPQGRDLLRRGTQIPSRWQQRGIAEEEEADEAEEGAGKEKRPGWSSNQLAGDHDHAAGGGVMTIEKIMHKCGQSLIKPSVVSAPMDFLTTEAEYIRVWQVLKNWLCSAVSAKLRACIPKFFSLSYRVFNLGICIPTLELDSRFLERYGISQEQSLSSKSSLSPRAPQQVEFSRETLGKAAGLPPARAFYALEVMLCAVGKEAGLGTTLLVDCGVGVLAARGRVVKFTFVQGTDSLEVVHREPPPGHSLPHASAGKVSPSGAAKRGGIHSFGQCYIPYTSRANKELAVARSRETASLLRSLRRARADQCLPPQGMEGEEGMPDDDGVVETMRTWTPGVVVPTTTFLTAVPPLAVAGTSGRSSSPAARGNGNTAFKAGHDATAKAAETAIAGGKAKARVSRMTSPLRGLRGREKGAATEAEVAAPTLNPPPPPLMDVHARLRGSVLSPSPSPATCTPGSARQPSPAGSGGVGVGAATSCPPMGLEPTGVERLGSHYSPAAQALYLDLARGRLAWRDAGGAGCLRAERVADSGDDPGRGALEGAEAPWVQQRSAVGSLRASRVWSGLDSRIVASAGGHPAGGKTAAGGLPAAATVPPRVTNLPSGFEIVDGRGHVERKEPLPSPSPPSPAAEKRKLDRPVAPSNPRGSGTTPRRGTSGVRLTSAPRRVLSRAEREAGSGAGGSEGRSGGVAQKKAFERLEGGSEVDNGGGGGSGGDGGHGATAVLQAALVVKAAETEEQHQAEFSRYHYYLHRDTTLAESVADLQPPWQTGIVRKVLDGLGRRGGSLDALDVVRRGGSRESRYSGDSSSVEDAEKAAGHRPGIIAGGAEGNDPEDEEGEDKFEVPAAPNNSAHLARPTTRRVGQDSVAPSRASHDGHGDGSVVVEGKAVASQTASLAATPKQAATVAADKQQGEQVTARGVAAVGTAAAEGGMPEIPDRFRAGVVSRLAETCDAFQTSIRRAVLNYVLLDAGQRDRLGIPAVPPGFESEGWGWGKGRAVPESPPEWHRRYLRAREAMGGGGQIAGSPVLLAAQALLARCRDTRLLRLPRSAEEIRSSSWSPMTAEEFRSSQLRHLRRRVHRVRQMLYPGLSEALKARLGQVGGRAGGGSTMEGPPPPDGHVRRYLAAVNVMAASVLRGVVETALSDLLNFFRIHANASVTNHGKGYANHTQSPRSRSPGGGGLGGGGGVRGSTGDRTRGAGGGREARRGYGDLDDRARDAKQEGRQDEEEEDEKWLLRGCPPLFKVFLEDRHTLQPTSSRSRKLTCGQSLRELKEAVIDVVQGVVLCFADLPRVTYGCGNHEGHQSTAFEGSPVDEEATPTGASNDAVAVVDLRDYHDRIPPTATTAGSNNTGAARRSTARNSAAEASFPPGKKLSRQMSLYSEPDSSSGRSSDDPSGDGGDSPYAAGPGSDSSSVWSAKDLPRFATERLAMNGGSRGDVRDGDVHDGGGGDERPGSGGGAAKTGPPRLTVLSPTEPLVKDTIRDVQSYLREGSSPAEVARKVYQPFAALLEEEAERALAKKGAADANVSEKDLPSLAAALDRYKCTAAVLRAGGDAAPVEIPGRMVVVDCEEASRKLLQASGDLRTGVLQRVESTLGKIASGVTKVARTAILRLGKRPRSTEEMMEAIECLRTTRAEEQIKLQQQQVWMGQLLDFILKHGGLKQDMVAAVAGVHRVMVELATATDKAGKAIAEGKTQLQKTVEKAKRRLESDVQSMEMRITGFIETDGRPRDMSEKAAAFTKELDGLKTQAISICEEEAKIDGYTSGALTVMAEKVITSFQPYADVWSITGAVGPFITATARAPVTTLDPEAVSADHASMKSRLEALQKIMTSRSHAVPARATQESLRLLSTLEKDIPVMHALTNANMKDRHWWQVSALVGVTVSWEHPTTLQQLNELDVLTDAKVKAILRLSDDANAEHELEESTAEVDRFVSEEAVVRIKFGGDGGDAGGGGGVNEAGAQEGAGAEAVPRLDEDHLRGVLKKAEHCRKVVAEAKQTDAATVVADAAARAAAAAAAASGADHDQHRAASPPGIVETLETALSKLTRVSEAMLKCAEIVVEIESELEETTADEADDEELLRDAVGRWHALLSSRIGQSLKDLVDIIEEELVHLEEVSDA